MSLSESLGTGLFSDGTGNSSKDLTGLRAMVLSSGTYGGISGTTYDWWTAGYYSSSSTALTAADMRTTFNTCSKGGKDHPNFIVTTQTLFEKYESLLTYVSSSQVAGSMQMNVEGVKKLGDAGIQALAFKGVPIVWDELCPSTYMYFLNLDHMKLVVHADANFKVTPFVKPENQDARVAQILWMGNLTCDRRKAHGALVGRTA